MREQRRIELDQVVEWLALRFRVPRGWEIARHGIRPEAGSLVFVDRRHERLVVSWTDAPREPDLERLLSDFRQSRAAADAAATNFRGPGGFLGFEEPGQAGERVTRAVRYDAAARRLVEIVVLEPDAAAADGNLARALLEAFEVDGPGQTAGSLQAFDVALRVPERFRLTHTAIKPADARLEFQRLEGVGKRPLARLCVRRMGMARAWFDGNAEGWLRAQKGRIRYSAFSGREYAGHRALAAQGEVRSAPLARLLAGPSACRALLWCCERQNALYQVETQAPSGEALEPEAARVSCCSVGMA